MHNAHFNREHAQKQKLVKQMSKVIWEGAASLTRIVTSLWWRMNSSITGAGQAKTDSAIIRRVREWAGKCPAPKTVSLPMEICGFPCNTRFLASMCTCPESGLQLVNSPLADLCPNTHAQRPSLVRHVARGHVCI